MTAGTSVAACELDALLDKLIAAHGVERSALIPILQDVQEVKGFLSREAVIKIGERMNLPASKIYGVATFYNQFRFQAPGRYHIQVCRGTACHVKGSASVLDAVRHEVGIEPDETSRDGMFSLEIVACIGACGLAPVIRINEEYHAQVTPDSVRKIIRGYRTRAAEEEKSSDK